MIINEDKKGNAKVENTFSTIDDKPYCNKFKMLTNDEDAADNLLNELTSIKKKIRESLALKTNGA